MEKVHEAESNEIKTAISIHHTEEEQPSIVAHILTEHKMPFTDGWMVTQLAVVILTLLCLKTTS